MSCSLRRVLSEKGWGEVEVGAGEGLNLGLKGFRNFTRGTFGDCALNFRFTPTGILYGSVASKLKELVFHVLKRPVLQV